MQGNDESWFDLLLENFIAFASSLPFPYLYFIISLHPLLFFPIYNTHSQIYTYLYFGLAIVILEKSLSIFLKWSSSSLNIIRICPPFSFLFLHFLGHWMWYIQEKKDRSMVASKRSLLLIFSVTISLFLNQKVTHVSAFNNTKPYRQVSSLRLERIQKHLNKINKPPVFTIQVIYIYVHFSNAFVLDLSKFYHYVKYLPFCCYKIIIYRVQMVMQ